MHLHEKNMNVNQICDEERVTYSPGILNTGTVGSYVFYAQLEKSYKCDAQGGRVTQLGRVERGQQNGFQRRQKREQMNVYFRVFEMENKILNYWEYTCSKRREENQKTTFCKSKTVVIKILASKKRFNKRKDRGGRFGGNE